MKVKAKIRKRKGRTAYELTIPIEVLESLGWIKKKTSSSRVKENKNEYQNRSDEIDVTLYPEAISKKFITIELDGNPERGLYPIRNVQYKKNNQKERKAYNKRMEEFKHKIKEKQIKNKIVPRLIKQIKNNKKISKKKKEELLGVFS